MLEQGPVDSSDDCSPVESISGKCSKGSHRAQPPTAQSYPGLWEEGKSSSTRPVTDISDISKPSANQSPPVVSQTNLFSYDVSGVNDDATRVVKNVNSKPKPHSVSSDVCSQTKLFAPCLEGTTSKLDVQDDHTSRDIGRPHSSSETIFPVSAEDCSQETAHVDASSGINSTEIQLPPVSAGFSKISQEMAPQLNTFSDVPRNAIGISAKDFSAFFNYRSETSNDSLKASRAAAPPTSVVSTVNSDTEKCSGRDFESCYPPCRNGVFHFCSQFVEHSEDHENVDGASFQQADTTGNVSSLEPVEGLRIRRAFDFQPLLRRVRDNGECSLLLQATESDSFSQPLRCVDSKTTSCEVLQSQTLVSACHNGNKSLVTKLFRLGADINQRDEYGNTPLLIAAGNGFCEIVNFLLTRKADVNAINSDGNTALIVSSCLPWGSRSVVKCLLKEKDIKIHHRNHLGYSALMTAVEKMDIDTMQLLLEHHFKQNMGTLISVDWDRVDNMSNAAGETTQEIAEKRELGKVYEYLKDSLTRKTSPLILAIDELDIQAVNLLLDCQFLHTLDNRHVNEAFSHIFNKMQLVEGATVSELEMSVIDILLQHDAKVNTALKFGWKPVSVAVRTGDARLVELLCQYGAQFYHVFCSKQDPLCIAASNGRSDLLKIFLKHKPDMKTYYYPQSAVGLALSYGHIECARLLIQHGASTDYGYTLALAVQHGQPESLQALFEFGKDDIAKFLSENSEAQARLLISAVQEENFDILEEILKAGADINAADYAGAVPLTEAKSEKMARFLIEHGADVNKSTRSMYGHDKPIVVVLKSRLKKKGSPRGLAEVVQVLLEHGASAGETCVDGRTPLMVTAAVEGNEDILELLLGFGADVRKVDSNGNTALMHAIRGHCTKNAIFLIRASQDKADVLNLPNFTGVTLLMTATADNSLAVVLELIKFGADVNMADDNGNTSLFYALKSETLRGDDVLSALISANSKVTTYNNDGLSPLMLAAKMQKRNALVQLVDAGADVNELSAKNNRRTALSFLTEDCQINRNTVSCIEFLVQRGAIPSYMQPSVLHRLILKSNIRTVLLLIMQGLGPSDVFLTELVQFAPFKQIPEFSASPVFLSLLVGNVHLARFLYETQFLTKSDVSGLLFSRIFRRLVEKINELEGLNFLNDVSAQPFSLFTLSFVTVSAAVGNLPGRDARIAALPLPSPLKDKLLFKSSVHQASKLAKTLEMETMTLDSKDLTFRAVMAVQYLRSQCLDTIDSCSSFLDNPFR